MAGSPFIVGDWGTTRLRLALCIGDSVAEWRHGPGLSALTDPPEATFLALSAPWRAAYGALPAYLSGMVGSRLGWREAPYAPCPADVGSLRAAAIRFTAADCPVTIMPGLTCTNPLGAPDVMRGEETQILGALSAQPALGQGRHLLCLPGTHTKWAALEDGQVALFLTAPTGEFYALLRQHSTLAKAAITPDGGSAPLSAAGFAQGLARFRETADRATLLQILFEVRSRQLIEAMPADVAAGYLSGLLIGADVSGALASFADFTSATIIGDPALGALYAQALAHTGLGSALLDGADCALLGLRALFTSQPKA